MLLYNYIEQYLKIKIKNYFDYIIWCNACIYAFQDKVGETVDHVRHFCSLVQHLYNLQSNDCLTERKWNNC